MRPTLLGFRSPKEKTPPPYSHNVTHFGTSLSFCSPKGNPRLSKLGAAVRFTQYGDFSKRTGVRVGPGSYSPEQKAQRIRGTPVLKPPHGTRQPGNNERERERSRSYRTRVASSQQMSLIRGLYDKC